MTKQKWKYNIYYAANPFKSLILDRKMNTLAYLHVFSQGFFTTSNKAML